MRNNKKRGFTLVELLVVIAILAILATVSVVGYTSFIQRASISNDENVAAQLNKFLVAVKADSTGPFYNEKITAENIREVTDYILEDSGFGKENLIPQSADYGYHIYFDLEAQEYVVVSDKDNRIKTQAMLGRLFAMAAGENLAQSAYPESCFTDGGKLFLIETGTELADLVARFKTVASISDLSSLYNDVKAFKLNKQSISGLISLVEYSVFVTKTGTVALENIDHTNIIIANDATYIDNKISFASGDPKYLGGTNYLFAPTEDVTIHLPTGIRVIANSMNINTSSHGVTVVFNETGWTSDVVSRVDANFTTNGVTLVMNGEQQKLNAAGNKVYALNEDGTLNETAEGLRAELSSNNSPVDSFKIKCEDVVVDGKTKVTMVDGKIYIADDYTGTLTLVAYDFAGKDGAPVSSFNVTWSSDNDQYTVNATTGVVQLNPDRTTKTGDTVITATATAGNKPVSINLNVVRVKSATITLDDATFVLDNQTVNNSTIQWAFTGDNDTMTFGTTFTSIDYTYEDEDGNSVVDCDTSLDFDTTGGVFTENNGVLTLTGTAFGEQTVTITVGNSISDTFTVNVVDNSAVAFAPNFIFDANGDGVKDPGDIQIGDNYLFRVGNKNTIKLSALFNSNKPGTYSVSIYDASKISNVNGNYSDAQKIATSGDGFRATYTPGTSWGNGTIQFSGTGVAIIRMSNEQGNRDIAVEVVDGTNISSYGEWPTDGSNIVLLSNITMPSNTSKYMSNQTLYGNGFTFDVTAGKTTGGSNTANYVVSLVNSTLDNVKIVGAVFNDVGGTASANYSVATVLTQGKSYIYNCYISNCASPVRIHDGDLTIKNTTLKGGTYCNLDIRGGNTTLENVITINQVDLNDKHATENKAYVGLGIVVYYEAAEGTKLKIIKDSNGNTTLTQYNYVSNSQSANTVSSASTLVNAMFSNSYSDYQYTDASGAKWLNAGIISMAETQFSSDSLTNVPNGYEGKPVSMAGRTGYAWTYLSADVEANMSNKPTTEWTRNQEIIKADFKLGTFNDRAEDANKIPFGSSDGTSITIGLGAAANNSTYEFNILNLLSATKYGKSVDIGTITCVGSDLDKNNVTVPYSDGKLTFTKAGTYTITVVVEDNLVYNSNGANTNDENYSFTIYVEVTKASIPDAIIDTSALNPSNMYYGSSLTRSYYFSLDVLTGLKIYDNSDTPLTEAQLKAKVEDGSLTVYVTFANGETFVKNNWKKFTYKSGSWLGSGGSNSDSGKYYFCAGTEASVTLNTTHSVTYYYKGENGKTIVSGTVTFTSTTSQAVVKSSSMSAVNANSNIKLPNEN